MVPPLYGVAEGTIAPFLRTEYAVLMAIEIGHYQRLEVRRVTRAGAVLTDGELEVLLPKHAGPNALGAGDSIDVFVRTETDGTLVATTQKPHACVGEVAYLTAVDVTPHGAFVDWGLDKELFVPFAEQEAHLRKGGKYPIVVRLDDRGERIIGSTRLARWFEADIRRFVVGQAVSVLVYRFSDLGAQVVVEHRYSGLVHRSDIFGELMLGQSLTGYVRTVRGDGKLDIVLRAPGSRGRDQDVTTLLAALEAAGGQLPIHDDSSPREIERAVNMSKKAFKRAAGNLLRERRITLSKTGISLAR